MGERPQPTFSGPLRRGRRPRSQRKSDQYAGTCRPAAPRTTFRAGRHVRHRTCLTSLFATRSRPLMDCRAATLPLVRGAYSLVFAAADPVTRATLGFRPRVLVPARRVWSWASKRRPSTSSAPDFVREVSRVSYLHLPRPGHLARSPGAARVPVRYVSGPRHHIAARGLRRCRWRWAAALARYPPRPTFSPGPIG